MSGHSAEKDAHRIVAIHPLPKGVNRYTCACGEEMRAHPDVFDEAFTFHLTRVTPPGEDAES